MIIKAYIRKHLFHLPRKQSDLTELIEERFYKRKKLVKSALPKMYPISEIQNENISYSKDLNIFLLNLYLLVLQKNGVPVSEKDIDIQLTNEKILIKLGKMIDKDLKGLSIEEIETEVSKELTSTGKSYTQNNTVSEERSRTPKNTEEQKDVLQKINFSIDWVSEMDKKLKE